MLKVLPPISIGNRAKAKCGEIFFHNSTEFTIYCVCGLKSFNFDDFLSHIQNVHFENDLLKTESFNNGENSNHFVGVDIKSENPDITTVDQLHEEEIWDNTEHHVLDGGDDDDFYSVNGHNDIADVEDSEEEEEPVTVLKKPTRKAARTAKRKTRKVKTDSESGGDEHSSDEDYKPMVSFILSLNGITYILNILYFPAQ